MQRTKMMPPENVYGSRSRVKWAHDQIKPDSEVAEFGCGTGLMLAAPLRFLGVRITGWDIHTPSIEYGRLWLSQHGFNPQFLRARAFEEVPDGSLDVVIASEVLEHLTNAELPRVLGLLRSKLSHGGQLLITVPNGYGWFEFDQWVFRVFISPMDRHLRFFRAMNRVKSIVLGRGFEPPYQSTLADDVCPHVQWFSKRTIIKTLEKSGFRVVSFAGSTLVSGPISNLFITGVPVLMAANLTAGRLFGRFSSGFRLVAILDESNLK